MEPSKTGNSRKPIWTLQAGHSKLPNSRRPWTQLPAAPRICKSFRRCRMLRFSCCHWCQRLFQDFGICYLIQIARGGRKRPAMAALPGYDGFWGTALTSYRCSCSCSVCNQCSKYYITCLEVSLATQKLHWSFFILAVLLPTWWNRVSAITLVLFCLAVLLPAWWNRVQLCIGLCIGSVVSCLFEQSTAKGVFCTSSVASCLVEPSTFLRPECRR